MRGFLVLCVIAVAAAYPQGYNYGAPSVGHIGGGSIGGGHIGGGSIGGGHIGGGSIGGGHIGGAVAHGPVVTKHFHIFGAPEESAEEARREVISAGPGHKHYRVVFIKAPHQSASAAALSVAQAQNEEKTVIYVLSKKTDAADIQTAIHAAPHHPTKPEVFFIKYKTPAEAAHAQRTIQAQYDSLGGTSQVSDEGIAPISSVIGSLGGGHHHGGSSIGASSTHSVSTGYLPPSH